MSLPETSNLISIKLPTIDFPDAHQIHQISTTNYGKIDEADTRLMELLGFVQKAIIKSCNLGLFETQDVKHITWEIDNDSFNESYLSNITNSLINFFEKKGFKIHWFVKKKLNANIIEIGNPSYWKISMEVSYYISWKKTKNNANNT
jgi:hypothetical protein